MIAHDERREGALAYFVKVPVDRNPWNEREAANEYDRWREGWLVASRANGTPPYTITDAEITDAAAVWHGQQNTAAASNAAARTAGPAPPPTAEDPLAAQPLAGRTHAEVLELTLDGATELVQDLVEAGVVGTIAGVPESHKSWLAQATAVRVAASAGEILGRPVLAGGPVGYFWQDDSTANEAGRVKDFEQVHPAPPGIPLTWFLNPGLELPRDLQRLRATIETHGFVLAVLDSFYNVASGDLRDLEAGALIKRLKTEVCDPTGCTILIVDHMAWATDANRGRLRAYGDVFKSAAFRFGIYIDAERGKLRIEARGNNVRGFKRTPAYWDAERLELCLVDDKTAAERDHGAEIADFLIENDAATTAEIVAGTGARAATVRRLLKEDPRFHAAPRRPGVNANAKCWSLSPSRADGTGWDELPLAQATASPSGSSSPVGGTTGDGLAAEPVPDSPPGEEVAARPDVVDAGAIGTPRAPGAAP